MNNLKRYTQYILNFIDIVTILISYEIAYLLRAHVFNSWRKFNLNADYRQLLLIVIVSFMLVNILSLYNDDKYLKRNTREEFVAVVKMSIYILIFTVVALYFLKMGEYFSRLLVGLFFLVFGLLDFLIRVAVKKWIIPRYQKGGNSENLLLVVPDAKVDEMIDKIRNTVDWRYNIAGLVISDKDCRGEFINDIRVISDVRNMIEDVASENIDSVFLIQGKESTEVLKSWMNQFRALGKIVHVQITEYELSDSFKTLDTIGDSAVVTYRTVAPMPRRQQLFRRIIDIIFGLLLLPIFIVVYLITFICSLFETPGHLLVSRVRVGKNSRRFFQYRFRVYRVDAKERVAKGQSPYSFYGRILRVTHLDGLPMILNILTGDMSFIGPKAPNLQRYLAMDAEERSTLSIKPGTIGYWSCEVETDKVHKDEKIYIRSWNILKDLAIIFFMIVRYITGNSLRIDGGTHIQEEYDFLDEIKASQIPYAYEHNYKEKPNYIHLFFKRIVDIVFSGLGLLVLSPVYIILIILIIADDGGNPFYSHKRIGKHGKRISVLKFRTMQMNAGDIAKLLTPEQLEQYRTEFKVDDDPRITNLGNFLRRSSLDELPQLINVFFGQMSLIGPRPVVEEELEYYGKDIAKLLSVKPGLTGYWQAYARNKASYETGERQKMEMYYIDHNNLWLDIKIFFKTIITVFTREGAQ